MSTDVLPKDRLIVWARAGHRCEVCGAPGQNIHHRRRRGMGGTRRVYINKPSNLILVCGLGNTSGCHGRVESHDPELDVYGTGLLVREHQVPAETPVRLRTWGWVLLTDDGCMQLVDAPVKEHHHARR